ncbi:unnamed protein product [Pedinophyceae sp. YPF-701]|nr:unnamed protein product [Pedinophyceae sp. YPF-701]
MYNGRGEGRGMFTWQAAQDVEQPLLQVTAENMLPALSARQAMLNAQRTTRAARLAAAAFAVFLLIQIIYVCLLFVPDAWDVHALHRVLPREWYSHKRAFPARAVPQVLLLPLSSLLSRVLNSALHACRMRGAIPLYVRARPWTGLPIQVSAYATAATLLVALWSIAYPGERSRLIFFLRAVISAECATHALVFLAFVRACRMVPGEQLLRMDPSGIPAGLLSGFPSLADLEGHDGDVQAAAVAVTAAGAHGGDGLGRMRAEAVRTLQERLRDMHKRVLTLSRADVHVLAADRAALEAEARSARTALQGTQEQLRGMQEKYLQEITRLRCSLQQWSSRCAALEGNLTMQRAAGGAAQAAQAVPDAPPLSPATAGAGRAAAKQRPRNKPSFGPKSHQISITGDDDAS